RPAGAGFRHPAGRLRRRGSVVDAGRLLDPAAGPQRRDVWSVQAERVAAAGRRRGREDVWGDCPVDAAHRPVRWRGCGHRARREKREAAALRGVRVRAAGGGPGRSHRPALARSETAGMVSDFLVRLSIRSAMFAGAITGFTFGLFAGGTLGAIISWFSVAIIDW